MKGLGDNIYQRPFIRSLLDRGDNVWVATPWPELYSDLDVGLVKCETHLRTQAKNQARHPSSTWSKWPTDSLVTHVSYAGGALARANIFQTMEKCFGVAPAQLDLPNFESPISGEYVVVRPVTTRAEWRNVSRSPDPVYIQRASSMLKKMGIRTIGIADLEPEKEWLVGTPPTLSETYYKGELSVTEILGLVRGAKAVVGGVGWILPACLAYLTPLFCIGGGNGGHNHPSRVTDNRFNLSRLRWALPDHVCMCTSLNHNCNKTITGFDWAFEHFMKTL